MTCEQARELAALAVSGDVTAAERRSLDLHNSGCQRCRAEAEGFDDLLAQLGAMREEDLPESAAAAVRARVLAEIPTHHRPGWLAAWPAFAAVVVGSLVLVVLLRPGAPVLHPGPQQPATAPVQTTQTEIASAAPAPAPEAAPAKPHRVRHSAPNEPAEPTVVHMFTSDPDVVIYWIADSGRKSSETGAM
jgi:hypothetical protein